MKAVILLLVSLILLYSCNQKHAPQIPAKKMEKVLADIHLAEVYSMLVGKDSSNRTRERNFDSLAVYYQTVFKHHKVTYAQFQASLDWYKQHPEELDSIYVKMIPEMTRLEGNYQYRVR